jgi:hypothetical protein
MYERVVVDAQGVAWTCTERTDRVPPLRNSVRLEYRSSLLVVVAVMPADWRTLPDETLLTHLGEAIAGEARHRPQPP